MTNRRVGWCTHAGSAALGSRASERLRLGGEVFAALRGPGPLVDGADRLADLREVTSVDVCAARLRAVLGQGDRGPIQNLTVVVESAGVCVIPVVDISGTNALSAWVNGVPVVGIDPSIPDDRFRFALAHECAHLIRQRRNFSGAEKEADRFAGMLLFPPGDFAAAMAGEATLPYFLSLKSAWGIPVGALIHRAHQLGYVSESQYWRLKSEDLKWQKSEHVRWRPRAGWMLTQLVERHGGTRVVSERLGLDPKRLSELRDWCA